MAALPALRDADGRRLDEHGWVQIDGFLPATELAAAQGAMHDRWPNVESVGTDQFSGIDELPFRAVALSLLALHPALLDAATAVLGTGDIRLYHAEAWAKRTGAARYEQSLHRDFPNHTLVVPSSDPRFAQLLCYLYLSDVTEGCGPPCFVSRSLTADLPLFPAGFNRDERPDLYAAEVAATGPAGTLVMYRPDTFHRGTELTEPGAFRHTLLVSFRPAAVEWGHRYGWADRGNWHGLVPLVERASPRQLAALGFPPPGHPYWTPETRAGVALRYPGLDVGQF